MSDMTNKPPFEDTKPDDTVSKDFNRTVVIAPNHTTTTTYNKTMVFGEDEAPAPVQKKDVEDLVSGVDINPYISLNLDASSHLESALDAVDTKYAMLTEFAEGGTAAVSIARDRNLRRLVAIKSLKKDAKNMPEQLKAFVTEAKVTAQLDHPGIIPIYGLFRDDEDGIHLVMKLVNGKTLREYLDNLVLNYRIRGINAFNEQIQLRKRLELFLRVCDTIAYAHHRNVIHRDLKPDNIMIGKYMEVFVMDWGLAKVISDEDKHQPPSAISGTARYFPPEVLQKKPLDLRSDIFTLGLILQEVVTLQYAVTGNDYKEFIDNILHEKLEPIEHRFHRKIDKTLCAIIQKATAYNLQERYQTVDEFSEDLRRYMGGLSVSVQPENIWDRFKRYVAGFFR